MPLGHDGDFSLTSVLRLVPSIAATSIFGEVPQSVQYINLIKIIEVCRKINNTTQINYIASVVWRLC